MKAILPSGQALYVYCLEGAIKEFWVQSNFICTHRATYKQIDLCKIDSRVDFLSSMSAKKVTVKP